MCDGHIMKSGSNKSLMLTCPAGVGEERTNGRVEKVSANTLTIAWNGGSTDTYFKVAEAPAKLPKAPANWIMCPASKTSCGRSPKSPGRYGSTPRTEPEGAGYRPRPRTCGGARQGLADQQHADSGSTPANVLRAAELR